ncbi:hypothetical protein OH76DRAFT_1361303 [Lentinus brumalis]|uniref:Uncharacterized protein n=1 Tax=Lentinus brumalis TaxID=2498619 RepID=A0A371CSV6_9APHY|nr:hypothetical protein OH76DRAFT_1361303 [Polyporus brumalis]
MEASAQKLCLVPIFAFLPHCTHSSTMPTSFPKVPAGADFPSLMRVQNQALDELTGHSAVGSSLAMNLKHAELAVKDLIAAVQASNMTTKDALADVLIAFTKDTRLSSRDLQEVSAKMNSFMDSVAVFSAYVSRTISDAKATNFRSSDAASIMSRAYEPSMQGFSSQINLIVTDTIKASCNLETLEDRLGLIHALSLKEFFDTAFAHDKLLWDIWAFLDGTYSAKSRDLQYRTSVLTEVDRYRTLAAGYIAATTQTLLMIDAELSELRRGLLASGTGTYDVPIDLRLGSIERTLHRLKEEVLQARVGVGSSTKSLLPS